MTMEWLNFYKEALEDIVYLDASLSKWLLLVLVTTLLWTLTRFCLRKLTRRVSHLAHNSATHWDDLLLKLLEKLHGLVIFILCFYLSALVLNFSDSARLVFHKFLVVALFFQTAVCGNEIVAFVLRRYLSKRSNLETTPDENLAAYGAVNLTARFLLWSVLTLLLLDNLGVNITALITGLGIGGIAIALAVQNMLGDIFASLSIVLDRPFEVGDFVIVNDKAGTVENIGLKTSRIRSLSGEQLIFPNKTLVETDIRNFKRMNTRRIVFGFGVVYETPGEKLKSIPAMVQKIIEGIELAKFDRAHFLKYGDSSLDFEVVYIMQVPDYNAYMDVQQAINFALFDQFAREKIDFAYPTRTLIVRSEETGGKAPAPHPANPSFT